MSTRLWARNSAGISEGFRRGQRSELNERRITSSAPLYVGHGPHVEDDARWVLGAHYELPGRSVRRPFDVVHLIEVEGE